MTHPNPEGSYGQQPAAPQPRNGQELLAQYDYLTVRDYGMTQEQRDRYDRQYYPPVERANQRLDNAHTALEDYQGWMEMYPTNSSRERQQRAEEVQNRTMEVRNAQQNLIATQDGYERNIVPFIDQNNLAGQMHNRIATGTWSPTMSEVASLRSPGRGSQSPDNSSTRPALAPTSGNVRRNARGGGGGG
ncbi:MULTISPECIES: hypothetical protein [Micromonospora]|uniref:Uncharacterized protein n=1 Tax=Micromonospora yangpuensis TaxID=683228 RepID=A0A1C6VBN4_9ACTN|nr:hypothetical protein [Micromonospora yangpuensis]GGM12532.1 hypothetical protein GCM10012279_33310 [Micromonospora yangpuensis]SCL63753.1 hypothetical protein GA0070617_5290 [Micromonospora yangpuensis]